MYTSYCQAVDAYSWWWNLRYCPSSIAGRRIYATVLRPSLLIRTFPRLSALVGLTRNSALVRHSWDNHRQSSSKVGILAKTVATIGLLMSLDDSCCVTKRDGTKRGKDNNTDWTDSVGETSHSPPVLLKIPRYLCQHSDSRPTPFWSGTGGIGKG